VVGADSVDVLMVVPTQESGVGECGDASDFPWLAVVDVAGPDGRGTGLEFAVPVAGDDRLGDGWWDGPSAAADVEGFASASGDDPAEVGVLGELAGLIAGNDGT
jgi:hypothetical protein